MITPANPARPGIQPKKVKAVQAAEMIDTHGIKAVFIVQGIVFMSMLPETTAEATAINAACNTLEVQS